MFFQDTNLRPKHFKDLMVNDWPSPMDRHPLWKDFHDKTHISPWFDGAWGSTFRPKYAEVTQGFNKIASPVPIESHYQKRRVLAYEFPPHSHSVTSFDLPRARDVATIHFPEPSRTFVAQEHHNPANPPKLPVQTVQGSLHHGIQYQEPAVAFGGHRFKETNSKKSSTESNQVDPGIPQLRREGIALAKASEIKADFLLKRVKLHPEHEHMVIPIRTTNKRETPDLILDYANPEKARRLSDLATTPLGAVASTMRSQEIRGNPYY